MKHPFGAYFLVFSLLLTTPAAALASSGSTDSRYFIATPRAFWRNVMGARQEFDDGFTADLSDLQLSIARLAGLKPVEVKKFNILEEAAPIADQSVSPTPQMTPSQPVSWGVRAMLGDDAVTKTKGGEGVRVAVLDTGIDRTHPDLADRVTGCFDLTDATKGFIADQCDDLNGHGTHMAGIIAADGGPQGTGLYGFAPQASISVYRVCSSTGTCMSDDIAVAIKHATDEGNQIIVLGMGGEARSSFIDDAIAYAAAHDVLLVAAAGNDGPYEDSLNWPARNPAVIAVGAVDNHALPADFSSRGLNASTVTHQSDEGDVEFAAPGVNIESTFRDNGYAILSGTSMAAPHIAGLAALNWQRDAEHPAEATRQVLHGLARDVAPPGDDGSSGWGLPVMVRP